MIHDGFEIFSKYKDVQQKARRIYLEDGVELVNVLPNPSYSFQKITQFECIVQGDHDVYETAITLQVGTKKIATWRCTCPWYKYVWDRSPEYRHLQGRLCSHVLASYYYYQSGAMREEWEKWRMPTEKAAGDISNVSDHELFEQVRTEHRQYVVDGARARNIGNLLENKRSETIDLTGLSPEDMKNLLQNLFLK